MKNYLLFHSKKLAFGLALLFAAAVAEAAVNLSSVPLQTGSTVEPNILFVLDDSGSMRWGFMPDDLANRLTSDGRNLGSCGATVSFGGFTNLCGLSTNGRAYLASNHLNKSYFDPSKTYLPPLKGDGSRFANSTFTDAWIDGYNTSSSKVNLATSYRALMDDYYYYGIHSNSIRYGFTISPNVGVRSAFYYSFKTGCADIYNNSCYDLVGVSEAQRQNFANWFSFYRTRVMAAKAGIGTAFVQQGDGMRVGYGAINATNTVISGVDKFSASRKTNFINWLYGYNPTGATPLRKALDDAGKYFQTQVPWRNNPADANSEILTCRQNFTILMTDGYWEGDSVSNVGNSDNTAGSLIQGINNTSYQYQPKAPFADSYSASLADVAMKYWKTDLQPTMTNNVPNSTMNPAFWQHMVTYGVGLGVTGNVPPETAFAAITSGGSISWLDPFGSLPAAKIDDLLHAAVNSRGGFFSASDPDTFATELSKTLSQIVARVASASNLVGATSSLETNKQIFQGRFFSGDWTGDLWGYNVNNNQTPAWKASEHLNSRDWTSRNIFYSSAVGTALGAVFQGAISSLTADQVNYIRGDRSKELNKAGGVFRVRTSVLGDIAHSAPFYVGEPDNRFYERFGEWPTTERDSYAGFLSTNQGRTKAVYVGSNSGMLHAFNAVNGQEVFAYIPHDMLAKLPALTSKDYQHQFYVDGSVTVADAYVGNSWRSILVGTSGRGGKNVFALDVTRPESFNTSRVLWEKSIPELGFYTGQALIAKLPDSNNSAKWYAILGNGVNSQNHTASLILIPLDGGAHIVITAHTGSASQPNGLFQPEGLDVDNTGVVTKVYAGDLQGNIWEFDLTKANDRKVSFSGQPLFVARDAQGNRQAVTGGLAISLDGLSGNSWLFFGTGKYLEQTDQNSTQKQSWYGLVLPLTATGSGSGGGKNKNLITATTPITGRNELAERVITNVGTARVVSEVTTLDGKRGWFMDLPDSGERVVATPQMIGSTLVLNTMVPKSDQCSPEGYGYVMAIAPYQGARLKRNFFDIDGNKTIDDQDLVSSGGQSVPASGLRFESAPGQPIFYQDIMKVGLENAEVIDVVVDTDSRLGRVSWRELIN